MELAWEDPLIPDAPFFTKDVYDKCSLAPSVRELWTFLQCPADNASAETAKTSCSQSHEDAAHVKDNSGLSLDCFDSDDPDSNNEAEVAETCQNKTKKKKKKKKAKADKVVFPDPRLPFPCPSTLSSKEQNLYLGFLMNKKPRDLPETLKAKVNSEVMQFMRYLQDVARSCTDDYNYISQAAMQYSEDFFKSCLECIKSIPQLYQITEMTSLTGGTFNPGLTLTMEKQLLIMGNVDITDHNIVPAEAQLASDYQSVASESPPDEKAKDMHAAVSTDANAEQLSSRYEPHVCLTRDALFKLLDNHGPEFAEPWEVPVWIKLNPRKGSSRKKMVFIDSPLLKTEMTVRERSHFYHEESLKLAIQQSGSKNVFHLMTTLPSSEQQQSVESSQRNVVSFDNDSLDFEVDLTDLETFGESVLTKTPKTQIELPECVKEQKDLGALPSKRKTSTENLSAAAAEMNQDNAGTTEGTPQQGVKKTKRKRQDSTQSSAADLPHKGDSDDEKLVIDDGLSPASTPTERPPSSSGSPSTPVPESIPDTLGSPSPQKAVRQNRQPKKAKTGDQLGEILRMQTAMFNSSNSTKKCSSISHERNQNQDAENFTTPQKSESAANIPATEHKKILSEELQAGAEDEQDYKTPDKSNLLYKLYSLQDLLVMVRSSVPLTHSRKVGSQNELVPVHVLPKLEYQLSYGVECLTRGEACQLWTETLLHSSTISYIAHINAHSSKVALLRKLPVDWMQNISCGFKPSNSLNILHHLLKTLTRLDEGRYLIAHKAGEPFVTLLKEAAPGKVSRGAYNLQQLHGSVPQPPASGLVPWIPLDPLVVLPFHQAHCRVPCTFPPKAARHEPFQPNDRGSAQAKKWNEGGNKWKKCTKRTARRNNFIKKLIQKSV
uniref:Interactor of little elongation complex ELL subunit 2 n=1 Tax=Cynoglossus semilaevis TaxID=244447 RepID=A0A3P8URZ7_CYNSE